MSNKSPTALILGLGVTVALSFMLYSFFFKKTPQVNNSPPKDHIITETDVIVDEDEEEDDKEDENNVNKNDEVVKEEDSNDNKVVVDDESDNEEDDEDDEELRIALKTSYDDSLRIAKKLLQGEKFYKAAEKFSEAIRLAEQLGNSASGDIVTLYNNRSAMYEKCGELELSLTDIGLVLAMEPLHLKARIRRARIYEVQNKIKESCIDYMTGMLIEMSKGMQQQSPHQERIEALVKIQAASESRAVVDSIRNSDSRDLPSKAHCRNYFEMFASYHKWRKEFSSVVVDRDSLVQAVVASGGAFSDQEESTNESDPFDSEVLTSRLTAIHDLACYDIVNGLFKKAFKDVSNACRYIEKNKIIDTPGSPLSTAVAKLFSIQGTSFHLRANLKKAEEYFTLALSNQPLPEGYENALRLASVHSEVDANDEATVLYDSIEESFTSDYESDRSWLHIHRVAEWVSRDGEGKFRSEALEKATELINFALESSKDFGDDDMKKSCRLMALLKLVQLLSHTKLQMGKQPDNNDLAVTKESIEEAMSLFPGHETVQMLSVDLYTQDGKFDEALVVCDQMVEKSKGSGDAILIVMRANVLCQQGMTKFAEAQQMQSQQLAMEGNQLLQQGQDLYSQAIKVEPNCVEALIQLAQLKSLMGANEMKDGLDLCIQALPHARSRDEALDILTLKLMLENRLVAIEEVRSHGMQI